MYVIRDKWPSTIGLHEVQSKMASKSHIIFTAGGQQVLSLINYSSTSDISNQICLPFLVQKTVFLGYHSYRVTKVEHVYCFDNKVENCRQENRKQKWNFRWNAFISISHTGHITASEWDFSTFPLFSFYGLIAQKAIFNNTYCFVASLSRSLFCKINTEKAVGCNHNTQWDRDWMINPWTQGIHKYLPRFPSWCH